MLNRKVDARAFLKKRVGGCAEIDDILIALLAMLDGLREEVDDIFT